MTAHHHHFYLLYHFFSFLVKIWNNYNKTNKLDQKRWKINRYYSHFYQIMTTTRSLISSIQWLPQQQIINHHMSLITLQMYWMVCECFNQPRSTSSTLIPIWQKKKWVQIFFKYVCVASKLLWCPPGCPNKAILGGTAKRQKQQMFYKKRCS